MSYIYPYHYFLKRPMYTTTKNNLNEFDSIGCVVILIVLAFLSGIALGGGLMKINLERQYKSNLIKYGLAEYDSQTGEWRMKNEKH